MLPQHLLVIYLDNLVANILISKVVYRFIGLAVLKAIALQGLDVSHVIKSI